ncbi:MAG: hypothetical protein QME49_09175 [bacterium]|nr:hypothetical protein [bacterium]
MRKVLAGTLGIILMGEIAQAHNLFVDDARVSLTVPQLIELVGVKTSVRIVPGPEDYARDISPEAVVNYGYPTGNAAGKEDRMLDTNHNIGKGFATRDDALSLTIFTNAQDGAVLYVHGSIPANNATKGALMLEDTYISVSMEKTYILQNQLEGAYSDAATNSRTDPLSGGQSCPGKSATWLRLHQQAQHIVEVKTATKAARLIVFNVGVANLPRYTEGEYTNTLTFTLMPIIG